MDTARADILAARDHLHQHGWIAARNESFRHLRPPPLASWMGSTDALTAPTAPPCDASPLQGAGWTLHPVSHTDPSHITARWLDASDPQQRAELFAGLPLPGAGDAAPFGWAHRALCQQGLRLHITAGTAGASQAPTVWLQLRHQPTASVEAPLLVLELADGVRCVLLETHERSSLSCTHGVTQNLQIHLRLGQGAVLQHLRQVAPGPHDQVAHQVHAQLGRRAHYAQALIASGSAYHLQRSAIDLQGAHASARTAGLLLAADAALEQQVHTTHHAAHSRSHVEMLVLASGKAHAVANAHSHIAAGADAADVHQRLHGIPLTGQPRLVLRPHLEIHHDNVQAAHGATWGALPADALFYARQRGLDEDSARSLIVQGMATALLERGFDDPELVATLMADGQLAHAMAQHLANAQEVHHV
ncbi:SufD family Fe-S cluster assembly protein [Simplicispira psychrophila]|uniref:SufD family Fe-S cluster assembly protein n=1 Tax=Simplicispira psychrophila TaxID=80882 RepID=UPI00048130A9|nr:SufD family Fe-S cluster assembly protein [Simplicispira psychrophila]